jgi:ribosome-associated protein
MPTAHQTSPKFIIPLEEVEFTAVRAQGAGGQNVNKVSSAIHLRYNIHGASLTPAHKARLLALNDQRITSDGVLVIKAQTTRSQEQNKAEALARLNALVESVATPPAARVPTKPSRSAKRKRVDGKTQRGEVKALRGKVIE